ncbi:MAG: transposase [Lachnospiraceae bacterium]|nr:transposase [Lachnospiraceae bacterium]
MNAEKILSTITQNSAELEIKGVVKHGPCDEYRVVFPETPLRICPHCGSNDCVKKGGRIQQVRHIPVAKKYTFLTFHRRYYLCKSCNVSFPEPIYWLHPHARITMALYLEICVELQSVMSVKDVALRNGVSESVIRHVMNSVKFDRPPHLPDTISIDEFSDHTGIWDYAKQRWDTATFHCLIANGDMGCVFDILPSASSALLIEYFKQYSDYERSQVRFFTCDFRPGFRLVGRTCFPNAAICLDMFHIVRLQTDNIKDLYNAILRRARAEENEENVRLLFHAHRLLTAWKNKPGCPTFFMHTHSFFRYCHILSAELLTNSARVKNGAL